MVPVFHSLDSSNSAADPCCYSRFHSPIIHQLLIDPALYCAHSASSLRSWSFSSSSAWAHLLSNSTLVFSNSTSSFICLCFNSGFLSACCSLSVVIWEDLAAERALEDVEDLLKLAEDAQLISDWSSSARVIELGFSRVLINICRESEILH